ncbi:aminoacyl-tRNA hydrolase [candidate division KSB1 bacterium]
MYLIVGLGNPEQKYTYSRHNYGFLVLDSLASALNEKFKPGKGKYYYLKTKYKDKDIILVKPTTYMNNSGIAVAETVNYYKVDLENVLIVCDDLDLDIGKLRFRPKGGSGGNKGLESTIVSLGTEEFTRLRLGINSDKRKDDDSHFVLSEFSKKEWKIAEFVVVHARDGILDWLDYGLDKVMNMYNSMEIEN